MASKEAVGGPQVCLVCLETHEVLRVVPTCKHVFCKKCLSTHLQTLVEAKGSFPCPTCQVESPIEGNDVDALLDYNGLDGASAVSKAITESARPEVSSDADDESKKENAACGVCRFTKKSDVDAENICELCGNIFLCKECTIRHGKNKTTKDHVVISVKSKQKKAHCQTHDKLINSYCVTCSKSVCQFCVLIDHEDHDINKFGEVFRSFVDDVKAAKEKQEGRSVALASIKNDLTIIKSCNIDKQGVLIKQIEEHADKCIDKIVKDKEALKDHVRDNFKMTKDISECLDKVPALAKRIDMSVVKATQLLSEAEPNPIDLEQLALVRDDMMMSAKLVDEIDKNGNWEAFEKLWSNAPRFVPNTDHNSFGTLSKVPAVLNLTSAQLVFEKKLDVDNEAKFIPCVTNLGNDLYAVAHPIIQGQPSDAVDIYKFPGEFKQTIRDHVVPLYDMAATPLGKLAVLSDGTTEGTCSVRLFDPVTGYIRSTKDFPIRHPLSFDVNLHNQYAILNNDGGRKITIFNDDGLVELTHVIDDAKLVSTASRIACSARLVHITREKGLIANYELMEKRLSMAKVCEQSAYKYLDISVDCFGSIVVSCSYGGGIYIHMNHRDLRWIGEENVGHMRVGADNESRISLRDNYIVISCGHTINVLTLLS